jgi:flagellar biosynthesis protein FlhB
VRGYMPALLSLNCAEPMQMARTLFQATLDVGLRIAVLLVVLAALDYAYQRWQYERDMRMTKQEVKDEHKMIEGNPEVEARIRRMQYALARRRMLADVKKADVVIRNPTHYAVALRYAAQKSAAPLVLAKGAGYLALRIIEIARKHNVPMVHEPPVAQALYKSVNVGDIIPPQLYRAVAKILVHIYRLRGRKPPQGH